MFTLKSTWKDMKQFFINEGTCEEALDWSTKLFDEAPDTTWKEILDHETISEAFIGTGIGRWLDEFDKEAREYMINKIQFPRRAINLYINQVNLTDAEEEILRSKFVGQDPIKEEALVQGICVRQKSLLIEE